MVLGFGDPTKGLTRILGHFVILDECECAILRLQIMLSTDLNYSTPKELTFFAINPLELMWSNSFTTTMHKSSLLFPNMSQTLV